MRSQRSISFLCPKQSIEAVYRWLNHHDDVYPCGSTKAYRESVVKHSFQSLHQMEVCGNLQEPGSLRPSGSQSLSRDSGVKEKNSCCSQESNPGHLYRSLSLFWGMWTHQNLKTKFLTGEFFWNITPCSPVSEPDFSEKHVSLPFSGLQGKPRE